MKRVFGRFSRRVVLLGMAALALAGGIAYAAIPDAGGTIHACLNNQGQVRIIDTAQQQCKANETAISWSQTGPQGPQGPTGPQGPQGATGAQGPQGSLGDVQVVHATAAPDSGGFATATVNCPAGTTLTGGGADVLGLVGDAQGLGPRITASQPFNANQWLAQAVSPFQWLSNGNNTQWQVDAYALCASG
jgi:hypothetical protein